LKSAVVEAEFYAEDEEEHATLNAAQLQDVSSLVQTILERYLPPKWHRDPSINAVPAYLRCAIKLTPDVDINVPGLADALDKQAMQLFEEGDFTGALAMFKDSDSIVGDQAKQYNAACCHAKLGQVTDAIAQLQRSVDSGFDNWYHLQADGDLSDLWEHPEWDLFVKKCLARPTPPQPTEEPAEETPRGPPEPIELPIATPGGPADVEEPTSPVSITSTATEEFPEEDEQNEVPEPISSEDTVVRSPSLEETVPVQPTPRQPQISEEDQNVLTLNAMGFDNADKCKIALQSTNGDVQRALDLLLSQVIMTPRV